jgi:hypothetical protein
MLTSLWHDLKYGTRLLRLNPGFAATAVLSLALGIAANTSIFTLVDQILLRLLPVHNPRELVQLRMQGPRMGGQSGDGLHTFSYPLYIAMRDRNTVFSGVTGYVENRVSMISGERSEMVGLDLVAGNFFEVLGVRPYVGQLVAPDDDKLHNGHPVVVLQYDFWQSRFAGRHDIVGSTIRLNGAPFTVVGVAAPDFGGTNAGLLTQMWAPINTRGILTEGAEGPRRRALRLVLPRRPSEVRHQHSASAVGHDRVVRSAQTGRAQGFLLFQIP